MDCCLKSWIPSQFVRVSVARTKCVLWTGNEKLPEVLERTNMGEKEWEEALKNASKAMVNALNRYGAEPVLTLVIKSFRWGV